MLRSLPAVFFFAMSLFPLLFSHCNPEHQKSEEILCASGSNQFGSLVNAWKSEFQAKEKSTVPISLHLQGNGTVPRDLASHSCSVGFLTRELSPHEEQYLKDQKKKVILIPLGIKALSVYKRDPSSRPIMTLTELKEAFTNPGKTKVLGLNSASEEYRWFKQNILDGQNFTDLVQEKKDTRALLESLNSPEAIGYGRITGEVPEGISTVGIKTDPDSEAVYPEATQIRSMNYPLAYKVYLAVEEEFLARKTKNHPNLLNFLRYILSDEGSSLVPFHGFFELNQKTRMESQSKLTQLTEPGLKNR